MTQLLHWVAQDTAYTNYSSRERVLTMDKVGLNLIASSLTAAGAATGAGAVLLQVAERAVDALKTKSEPLRLFNSRTTKPNGSRFLVAGCRESQDGVVVMAVGAVEVKTEFSLGSALLFNWNSVSVDVRRSADVFVFHRSLYALSREIVRERLLKAANAAFVDFPI